MAILEAEADPLDNPETQLLAVSYCLAEALETPFLPSKMYNAIVESLNEIEGDAQDGHQTERELRAGCLVPAMIHAARAEGKANEKA